MNNLWESFGVRSPPQIAPKLFTGGFEKPNRDGGLKCAAVALRTTAKKSRIAHPNEAMDRPPNAAMIFHQETDAADRALPTPAHRRRAATNSAGTQQRLAAGVAFTLTNGFSAARKRQGKCADLVMPMRMSARQRMAGSTGPWNAWDERTQRSVP